MQPDFPRAGRLYPDDPALPAEFKRDENCDSSGPTGVAVSSWEGMSMSPVRLKNYGTVAPVTHASQDLCSDRPIHTARNFNRVSKVDDQVSPQRSPGHFKRGELEADVKAILIPSEEKQLRSAMLVVEGGPGRFRFNVTPA